MTASHVSVLAWIVLVSTVFRYTTALPFDELGFKPVTKRPLPSYTWAALRMVPGIFLTVGGSLSLLSWFNHRKERIQKEAEQREASGKAPKEDN